MNPPFEHKSRLMAVGLSILLLLAAVSAIYWMFIREPQSQDRPQEVAALVHTDNQNQSVSSSLRYAFSSQEREHIQNVAPLPGEDLHDIEELGSGLDNEDGTPSPDSTALTDPEPQVSEPAPQGGWVKGKIVSESDPASADDQPREPQTGVPSEPETAAPSQEEPATALPAPEQESKPADPPKIDVPVATSSETPTKLADLDALRLQDKQDKPLPKGPVWVINALSTLNDKKMNRLLQALKPSYKVYAYQVQVKGKIWKRVRVGFFGSKEDAQKTGEKIARENNLPEPWIVQPGPVELPHFYEP